MMCIFSKRKYEEEKYILLRGSYKVILSKIEVSYFRMGKRENRIKSECKKKQKTKV